VTSSQRLRILVVTPSMPFATSWGFGIRVFQLVRQLASRHSVTVLTYGLPDNARDVAALRELGAEVTVVTPPARDRHRRRVAQLTSLASGRPYQYSQLHTAAMQRELDCALNSTTFDIIQVESSQMGGFDFHGHPAVILDEHNIEYELLYRSYRTEPSVGRKLFNAVEYLKVRRAERAAWRRADGCLLTSGREADLVRRIAPSTPIAVIPNGVDLEYFSPGSEAPDPDSILFTGLLTYRPNLDAVRHFTREVLPLIVKARPSTKLTVVGYGPREMLATITSGHVKATGWVPDVRPYLRAAAAVVVPVRMGSGTRLKVLDGLAAAKPIVTTSLGCEGIDVKHGEHVLVGDEPRAFAEHVLAVLGSPSLATELGRGGRRLVEEKYSWSVVGEALGAFYRHLADGLIHTTDDLDRLPA
jgi:glycosyltransferase involved in cell wall biosynthesis